MNFDDILWMDAVLHEETNHSFDIFQPLILKGVITVSVIVAMLGDCALLATRVLFCFGLKKKKKADLILTRYNSKNYKKDLVIFPRK